MSESQHAMSREFKEVLDSGARRQFETGSVRDVRDGKGRFDLIPPLALRRLARHYENGAKKYGDNNWQKGQPLGGYLDSAFRHLMGVMENLQDEDHQAAAIWNVIAYMWTRNEIEAGRLPLSLDDRGHVPRVDTALMEAIAEVRP